jgi:hypothetical protein
VSAGPGAEIDPRLLEAWCRHELQARPERRLFSGGHLAVVLGIELDDARKVVIKAQNSSDRTYAIVGIQRALFASGYPCPEPLAGPSALGGHLATAEAYVQSGPFKGSSPPAAPCALLLAELVEQTPDPSLFSALGEPPPWVAWDHAGPNRWPTPDDLNVDLNSIPGPRWLDESADRIRQRLRGDDGPQIIGHVDWEAHNLGWRSGLPIVVYDWDSLAIRTEPTIAGAAATVFASTSGTTVAASLDKTEEFLRDYETHRGPFGRAQREVAWAAGLWVLLFNAKKEIAGGGQGYLRHLDLELSERMRRAGV